MGEGESASLSGPELEVGDGGGRVEEMEGWKRREEINLLYTVLSCHVFTVWFVQVLCKFTCNEILDLLVFSLTLARTPLSPEDLSVISRAALSSLGVSILAGAAGS